MGQTQQRTVGPPASESTDTHPTIASEETRPPTTAKSQLVAVLSAAVVAKRYPHNVNSTITADTGDPGGVLLPSSSPSPQQQKQQQQQQQPARSLVEWLQWNTLVRKWAEEWVLRPVCDAVFRLPLMDHTQYRGSHYAWEEAIWYRHKYLCVSVSPTLGVVTWCVFGSDKVVPCCTTGPGKLLCSTPLPVSPAKVKASHSVVDAVSGAECWSSSPLRSCGCCAAANRKWLVCHGKKLGEVWVWKVVGGVPVDPRKSLQAMDVGLSLSKFHFSPLWDDVLVDVDCSGTVSLCDLEASFQQQKLVITTTLPFGGVNATDVMQIPGGSMCTVSHTNVTYCETVPCVMDAQYHPLVVFPRQSIVMQIGKSRCFVAEQYCTEYKVYDTTELGVNNMPSLCVPCSWSCASQQSGLIASADVSNCKTTELGVSVRDGITGFLIARSLVEWLQWNTLVRKWAEEWVLRPVCDAVFSVTHYGCGHLVKASHSVVDAVSGAECWSLSPLRCYDWCSVVNRKWLVCHGKKLGEVWIWKVVGGVPVDPRKSLQVMDVGLSLAHFEISPLWDDVLVDLDSMGTVSLCDLESSFQQQKLVITTTLSFGGLRPTSVMQLPGGAMVTLSHTNVTYCETVPCVYFHKVHKLGLAREALKSGGL
ncbi:hypothetical protein Pelo_3237 [Pelomyxa schiedti]|nr:hypothetical protein Pelo_3237 [Pelomyxa schiedti]